ncbi:MAG: hypothetical protein ACAH83_13610 [Alphaproteobacteria bacterium]
MLQKVSRPPKTGARKSFHLNEILSLASGLPLAREGQAAIHRLVAFVMETDASPSSTAANSETVKKCLEEQLPFLKEINLTGLYQIYQYEAQGEEMENPYLDVWMEMQLLKHGAEHDILPFSRWQMQKSAAPVAMARSSGA